MNSITYEEANSSRGTVSEFMTERRYLNNVTPKTLAWYRDSFKAFIGALESEGVLKPRTPAGFHCSLEVPPYREKEIDHYGGGGFSRESAATCPSPTRVVVRSSPGRR
jgi:hypothetical protein